jgi:sporulation integral membrane protein YlbJ
VIGRYVRKDSLPRDYALVTVFAVGGTAAVLGCLAMIDPQVAMQASLRGVGVWWEVLFPALFPFFVLSELLLGFGIVHLAGTLLDPFMRPLFRLPGVGGFVVAMGFASGYPVGARLTSRLMEQKLLTRDQGERLVAMTTSSDPIFLIGAVCIGFFGSLQPAPVLAVAHYGGALLIGLASRFHPSAEANSPDEATDKKPTSLPGGRLRAALTAMHRARLDDGRPFGLLLQQSLQSSITLMMIVGGLVVFFSAVLELLVHSGMLELFRQTTGMLLHVFGLSRELAPAFVNGTFEVTLGAKASAVGGAIPLVDQIAVAAFILSWAGLSVHAQVAGLMSRTEWRYLSFALARLLHGILAMMIVYVVWPQLDANRSSFMPVWNSSAPSMPKLIIPSALWLPVIVLGLLALIVASGSVAIGIKKLLRS